MRYIITTLGCKVNQYETQAMETILQERGHAAAAPGETADAVIVNTCAVTAESGRKSRQSIRRLRDENPDAVVGVLGCYSQLDPDEVQSLGVKVVYGTNDRVRFLDDLEKAVENGETSRVIDEPFKRRSFEQLPAGAVTGRTRAMLKIQDGCVNFCSYCIIPYTRGRLRSLPIEAAKKEAARLNALGYKELVLTGIEVASYGVDLPDKPDLADVIVAVAESAPGLRIRLGSLEPTVITEDFCRRLRDTGSLCRHFHLSLQSGCDRTLKAMNRKYDTARFFEATRLLREYFPGCALTCDLITGFPGETDEDQAATLTFIRRCAFSAMHVFPYSRRPGTPADKMPCQIPNAVKAKRAHEASLVASEMHTAFLQAAVGSCLTVLFETEDEGHSIGHSDTYVLVRVPEIGLHGQIRQVRINGVLDDMLTGEII